MKEQAKTPVFQEDNGTWAHLTKLVNPLICTIEYGRRTGFSSREEAEESYQRSLVSYHDQLSKLKKERDMPFTFSEYLDYWLNDVCAQGSNGSRTLVQKQWTINLIIQPHLHKDILLGCITPDYLNKVLESCQAYCCNGGYYAYKLLHSALKHARINNCLPDMDFQQIRHYPEPSQNPVFYSPEQLRTFLTAASNSNHYLEIQLALFCGLTPGEILGLKYDSFDPETGTVTICGLHARNYVSADRNGGDNSQSLKYSGRKLRSDSNYRTVPVPEFLFDEIGNRRYLNEGILLKYPGLAEEGALCLGPYGKVKTLPTLNTRLKKITQSYGLPRISLGDLRYMYLAELIKKEKQFKKIMELFGYANPYRMLNLCQQIADIQGETLTVNVPFPEVFYYKM